ncbi:MAG: TlpA disulfide reductase family protein [Balneolaceae bacterium]
MRFHLIIISITAVIIFGSCTDTADIEGNWRAWLESPGGTLAFPLVIENDNDELSAFVVNSSDTSWFTGVTFDGKQLRMSFDHYDAVIDAEFSTTGLSGKWTRTAEGENIATLPFEARKTGLPRYPVPSPSHNNFDGEWNVLFEDKNGSFPATGVFYGEDGVLHGTFLTETGDYRFLEGVYSDSTFTLSTFDGAHAFLFKAELNENGTLQGDFWSRDSYHATFTAERGTHQLRNPLEISSDEVIGRKAEFAFKDTEGNLVTNYDDRFQNKPLVVYLFGSWCPNCADEARLMTKLYEDYKHTGLEIVGLAFEFTGNFNRDAEMVDRYRKRFNIPWTLLVAGTSDKDDAAETIAFLDEVISYPTSVFTDSGHTIKFIHTGFNGPATGPYYYHEIERYKTNLNAITKQ